MPHRLTSLLFLALLLFFNFVVASPALSGRNEPGGDSLWELELNDVFGAAAAGLEGLYKLWDFSTAPGVTTIPPGVPAEQPDERQYQAPDTPGIVGSPLLDPTAMKTCAEAGESQGNQPDKSEVEKSWWQVEQEPETGYVVPPSKPQPTLTPKNHCGYDYFSQSRGRKGRNEER